MAHPIKHASRVSIMVDTPTGPIHSVAEIRDGAPWLAFSNSHGTDLSLWDRAADLYESGYSILRYDQRGHGKTPPASGATNFDSLAVDLIAVMDAHSVPTATLIGISMGAVTVLRAAARRPDRVDAVVASDGQWRTPVGGTSAWQKRIDEVIAQSTGAIAEPTISRWFLPNFRDSDPQGYAHVRKMIASTSSDGYIACAQALQNFDFTSDYPHLAMPVLYIAGAEDGALPATMKEMARATPHGRFVEIPQAGHLPNIERPDTFYRALSAFLDEQPSWREAWRA